MGVDIEEDGIGALTFTMMLVVGYAVAESLTNALGCHPMRRAFSEYVDSVDPGLERKKCL